MIWSRNVAVLVLAGVLLSFFGLSRLFFETAGSTPMMIGAVIVSDTESAPGAVAVTTEPDRAGFIATMRDAIVARKDAFISQGIPVDTEPAVSKDRDELDGATEADGESVTEEVIVRWCDATVLESQFVASWPTTGVSVQAREGARVVVVEPQVATSSEPRSPVTLMQFPLVPTKRAEPACLTHAYIGVTQDGRLIHNNDVILYQSYGPTELIGYAFDGHPIYGATSAEVDECGGVVTTGYGYHVSAERNFILGCFMSEPQQSLLVG